MDILNLFKKTYNTLDETIFNGILPLGPAAEIPGNTSTLNGEPVVYDGKKQDWVPREEYTKSNASKIGSEQVQAVQEVLTKVVNNPIVNTGLQIGSEVLERTGGPMFQKTITGQTPMEMIGKTSNLAITQPLSDLTNVDPVLVDAALALTPFGKAGISKLLKGLKVGKRLNTVNQFALPTSKKTPTTPKLPNDLEKLVELAQQADGSWGAGAGLAINPKQLMKDANKLTDVVKYNALTSLSLPKTGTQRPPLTSAAIVEKFKDIGFIPSNTLPVARQVAQVIKMDTQLARVSKLKNPNTRYEVLALPTWSHSTYLKSFNRLPAQLQKRILDLRARSGERVHLHHWNSKMVDAKRKERMIALVNEGKASRDDIRLLDFALESRGEPGGGIWRPDGTKTIGALPEGFHQGVHARYQAAGLEKKWNWGSAIEKELGSIDNPTDLIEHAIQQRESMVPINLRVKDEAQRLWGLRF